MWEKGRGGARVMNDMKFLAKHRKRMKTVRARSLTHSAICLQIFNVDYDKSKRVNSDDYNGDHRELGAVAQNS